LWRGKRITLLVPPTAPFAKLVFALVKIMVLVFLQITSLAHVKILDMLVLIAKWRFALILVDVALEVVLLLTFATVPTLDSQERTAQLRSVTSLVVTESVVDPTRAYAMLDGLEPTAPYPRTNALVPIPLVIEELTAPTCHQLKEDTTALLVPLLSVEELPTLIGRSLSMEHRLSSVEVAPTKPPLLRLYHPLHPWP